MKAELRRLRGRGDMSIELGPWPSALRPWQPVQRCMKVASPRLMDSGDEGTGFCSAILRGFNCR